MAIREKAFAEITRCFKRHGAVAISTPVFELRVMHNFYYPCMITINFVPCCLYRFHSCRRLWKGNTVKTPNWYTIWLIKEENCYPCVTISLCSALYPLNFKIFITVLLSGPICSVCGYEQDQTNQAISHWPCVSSWSTEDDTGTLQGILSMCMYYII